uniref:rRNA biogenesis protein RRP36 n=1 Tax=Angiostrongylus cantonensis TaxID=6313 RepID=A0A0K0DDG3_ANGCA
MKRKQHRELVEKSSADQRMLECVTVNRKCSSDGDVAGVARLIGNGYDDATIPMVNAMRDEVLSFNSCMDEFLDGSLERKPKIVKRSILEPKNLSTLDTNYGKEDVERLNSHGHVLTGVCNGEKTGSNTKIKRQKLKKESNNDVYCSKQSSEEWEEIRKKCKRGVRPHKSLRHFGESLQKDDSVEEEHVEEDEAVMDFRAKLADLPLGKVREVKERLGLKLFNKAYFGIHKCEEKEESRNVEPENLSLNKHLGQHRPKEITSKKPVSIFRPVYQNMKTIKRKRDPRFDSRAGLYKERCFEDNYSFLDDLRKYEREELSKEAAKREDCGDMERAAKIRETIRRMDNREKTKADRKLKQRTYQELRLENIDRMMRGDRPVFKTKAQVKMINMEKKFDQLKKEGKLDQYMKRKAKREARKEARKKLSFEEKYGYH